MVLSLALAVGIPQLGFVEMGHLQTPRGRKPCRPLEGARHRCTRTRYHPEFGQNNFAEENRAPQNADKLAELS
jgi:hypothetical protein